jgi:FkbM family methyltransferase
VGLREGIANHYSALGLRGVLLAVRSRVVPRLREAAIRHSNIEHPVHLRIRTSDVPVFKQIIVNREYDFGFPLPENAVIIDAGANIGMASVYFANEFPTAHIIALEPDTSNFAMLEKNVRSYPQIRPINAALWEKSISMRITHQEWGTAGRTCEPDESGTIRAITMAELCHRFEIDHIDLFKVDIEGAEKGIFENSSEWIGKVDRIVIELHDRCIQGCSESFFAATGDFSHQLRGEYTHSWRTVTA